MDFYSDDYEYFGESASRIYKCKFCDFSIMDNHLNKSEKSAKHRMGLHYETVHSKLLPKDMDGFRFFYFTQTKKDHGSCIECHSPTKFNRLSMKYSRFCDNPECKKKYKEERDRRMMKVYGKKYVTDDMDFQKKMLANRRISGTYQWRDGKEFGYVGSYERDFLRFLDQELKWQSSDLFVPSPHTYKYKYKDKDHFYIPDFFIPSLNLEIEIKDDGSAKKIGEDTRNKEKLKDELMKSKVNTLNYLKIINKDYSEFKKLLQNEGYTLNE